MAITGDHTTFRVGDTATFEVTLDTASEVVNAVEATIAFPASLLKFVSATTPDSPISVWVEQPTFDGVSRIKVSGITPGGVSVGLAPLLHLTFTVIAEGQGEVALESSSVLRHDGLGTAVPVTSIGRHIAVVSGPSIIQAAPVLDDEPPEAFTLFLTSDPDVYQGDAYLAFETQDKGSGMSHYEVREGRLSRYRTVTSPYRITHQALDRRIYVRAIDQRGNVRVSVLYPHSTVAYWQHVARILSILVVCVLIITTVGWRIRRVRISSAHSSQ